jgi:O-antigen/teichoic acid export membrane protein
MAISNWLQLSIVTRAVDLIILGTFTLAIAISNPFFQFFNLQLRSVLVTDRDESFSFEDYSSLRLISTFTVLIFGVLVSYLIFDSGIQVKIAIAVFCSYAIDALIDIFNGKLHFHERFDLIALSVFLRAICNVLGIVVGFYFFDNLFVGLLLTCFLKLLSFCFYDVNIVLKLYPVTQKFSSSFNFTKIKIIVIKALPLGITLLIASLNINVSKYFVNYFFGIKMQGLYSTMAYLIVVGTVFIATIGQVILPKISVKFYNNDLKRVVLINYTYLFLSFLVGVVAFMFSYFYHKEIITLFFSYNVAQQSKLLVWLMGSSLFIYLASAQGYCLTAIQIFKQQPYIGLIALIINVLGSLYAGKDFGMEGLIVITGLSFFSQFLVGLYFFKNKIHGPR